jgi:hypothetical protein
MCMEEVQQPPSSAQEKDWTAALDRVVPCCVVLKCVAADADAAAALMACDCWSLLAHAGSWCSACGAGVSLGATAATRVLAAALSVLQGDADARV